MVGTPSGMGRSGFLSGKGAVIGSNQEVDSLDMKGKICCL